MYKNHDLLSHFPAIPYIPSPPTITVPVPFTMQAQRIDLCNNFRVFRPFQRRALSSPFSNSLVFVTCVADGGGSNRRKPRGGEKQKGKNNSRDRAVKAKQKENVWSVDNEIAKEVSEALSEAGKGRRARRGRKAKIAGKRSKNSRVIVSAAMLVEVETVLQIQEPVIKPAWSTFTSSVSGIWKGVGAVFSPFTAEMEPIGVGNQNENLYDCYTLSHIDKVPPPVGTSSKIRRKINWVVLNPYGEVPQKTIGDGSSSDQETFDGIENRQGLPRFESFDFGRSDILEEDFMDMEPGLIFFEDGSYSRGPVDIPVGEFDESKYFLSPTFKFEQCLVKGCHKRLRIVHTIEFINGGSDIQVIRVAAYEEEWVCPTNLQDQSDDVEFGLKPFSQRKRTRPSQLAGSWKVFEVSATPIYGEPTATAKEERLPYVFFCMETLKKRSLPDIPVYFGEEEMLDTQDATALWLPGGVTAYIDVQKDGTLCIGVGWYSDEGINLVMERDYGTDGKLKDVRWKTEVKRRWSDSDEIAL